MRKFWEGCKRRPIGLWILFSVNLSVYLFFCYAAIFELHDPWGLLTYPLVVFPIIYLIAFEKPLKFTDVMQILLSYVGFIVYGHCIYFEGLWFWILIAIGVLLFAIAVVLYILKIIEAEKD